MSDYSYVKLTKKWGGFAIGDVVRLGTTKAAIVVGRKNRGVLVSKQRAVNDPPVIEQADQTCRGLPPVETAMRDVKAKPDAKAKAKANAEDERKAKAGDDKKAEPDEKKENPLTPQSVPDVKFEPIKKGRGKKKGGCYGRN